jgi:antitoxin component YwqK of YwqJK toxin-antitoxin module
MKNGFFIIFLALFVIPSFAQDPEKDVPFGTEGQYTFETDRPYKLLELDEKTDEPIATQKKKPRKKTYYGIKTKKAFTKKGGKQRPIIELFYVLRKHEPSPQYVKDIYWYDYKRREVRKTDKFDPKKGVLLHGPYKKMQGNVLIEEGIFFKGSKHGRWMRYSREDLLEDKDKYYKGWPKESLVSYYDPERTKVKELIPVDHGDREGNYYKFHDNGQLAVNGAYLHDYRVGEWVEFYPNGKRKKTIKYPEDPFDKRVKAFIAREWNEQGREVYSKVN